MRGGLLTAGCGGGGAAGDGGFTTGSLASFSSSLSEELDSLSEPVSELSDPLEELSELSDIFEVFNEGLGDLQCKTRGKLKTCMVEIATVTV